MSSIKIAATRVSSQQRLWRLFLDFFFSLYAALDPSRQDKPDRRTVRLETIYAQSKRRDIRPEAIALIVLKTLDLSVVSLLSLIPAANNIRFMENSAKQS